MHPQSMCLAKICTSQKLSTENCHFYSRENSLCFAWACFRNVKTDQASMWVYALDVNDHLSRVMKKSFFFFFCIYAKLKTQISAIVLAT